jgi:cation transport regulator ChaB
MPFGIAPLERGVTRVKTDVTIARTTMPKTTRGGEPKKNELPSTLQRSSKGAQRTFAKTHDAAAEQYGSEERAHRVAYAALKHSFEKVGDRWLRKPKKGPSDARAERGGLNNPIPSEEGVDANASKKHLLDIARRLDVRGRSKMDKTALVDAIKKHNRRAGAR